MQTEPKHEYILTALTQMIIEVDKNYSNEDDLNAHVIKRELIFTPLKESSANEAVLKLAHQIRSVFLLNYREILELSCGYSITPKCSMGKETAVTNWRSELKKNAGGLDKELLRNGYGDSVLADSNWSRKVRICFFCLETRADALKRVIRHANTIFKGISFVYPEFICSFFVYRFV